MWNWTVRSIWSNQDDTYRLKLLKTTSMLQYTLHTLIHSHQIIWVVTGYSWCGHLTSSVNIQGDLAFRQWEWMTRVAWAIDDSNNCQCHILWARTHPTNGSCTRNKNIGGETPELPILGWHGSCNHRRGAKLMTSICVLKRGGLLLLYPLTPAKWIGASSIGTG